MINLKKILVPKILLIWLASFSYAQPSLKNMNLPDQLDATQKNIINEGNATVNVEQNFWSDLFKGWTNFLWFILWAVIFAMIIYGWFLLITGQWDEKKQQKAIRILINSVIWILIALLAYTITTLVIKLA